MGEARVVPLNEGTHLQACVDLQRSVWSFEDPDLVSAAMLQATCQHGGTLLGGISEDEVVGFVLGFPAWWEGQPIEHSHMLAVLPEWRNRGLGRDLKMAQAAEARRRGIALVTWTFDPLEAKNAHLNLNRLGARVRHYYRDLYGAATTSRLHSGLGTDRFLAEWDVGGQLPAPVQPCRRGQRVVEAVRRLDGRVEFEQRALAEAPLIEVAVPSDIQALKAIDPALAAGWREVTREVFVHYLQRGYRVTGLHVALTDEGDRDTAYLVERPEGP